MLTWKPGWLLHDMRIPIGGIPAGDWGLIASQPIERVNAPGRGQPSLQNWALNWDYWLRYLVTRSTTTSTRPCSGSGAVGLSQSGRACQVGACQVGA